MAQTKQKAIDFNVTAIYPMESKGVAYLNVYGYAGDKNVQFTTFKFKYGTDEVTKSWQAFAQVIDKTTKDEKGGFKVKPGTKLKGFFTFKSKTDKDGNLKEVCYANVFIPKDKPKVDNTSNGQVNPDVI